ncbi:MAG: IPT/TIG domain-containing protein, partial [Bryocella sp.]
GNNSYEAASPIQRTVTVGNSVGVVGPTQTATVTMTTTGVLGQLNVLTQGISGADFKLVAGGTCAIGNPYNLGQTCTVLYSFTPSRPGQRSGGISLTTGSGSTATVLGSTLLSATGTGSLVAFPATTTVTNVGAGFNDPNGLAVDGNGNVFVADYPPIDPLSPGPNTTGINEVVAVNGMVTSSSAVIPVGSGFNGPTSVTVDGNGNVFVADFRNSAVKEIVAVNGVVTSASTVNTVGSGFDHAEGVAVDGSGNVFVADRNNNEVKQIVAVNGVVTSSSVVNVVGSGFDNPYDVVVDAVGNVFVADGNNDSVKEIFAVNGIVTSASTVKAVGGSFPGPVAVAVDLIGHVFVASSIDFSVKEIDLTAPPTLAFASTTVGGTSADSPKAVMLQNIGNAPLTFPAPATGSNPSIAAGFLLDGATTCPQVAVGGTAGLLAAGSVCNQVIDFQPTMVGTLSGSLTLTDNSLGLVDGSGNGTAVQAIPLSGTSVAPLTVSGISPTSGPSAGGTSVTIAGSGFTGATAVMFGSTAAPSFTVVSDTSITAVSPAGSGLADVTVTTPIGISATSFADQFAYAPPTVTSISPASGSNVGGTSVTIVGTNFTSVTGVQFGTLNAMSYTVNSATSITAVSPPGTVGMVGVTVKTSTGTSNSQQFSYLAIPAVLSLSPSVGPIAGGTTVTISGGNFNGATAVMFGTTAAS